MKSKAHLILWSLVFTFIPFLAYCAEELTITTYYPSPYGSYNELYVSNNVGIGTTGPVQKLDVVVSSGTGTANDVGFRLQDGTATTPKNLKLGINTTGNGYGYLQYTYEGTAHTTLALNPLGGNVGIGTTAPDAKLHVNGNIKAVLGAITGGQSLEYQPSTNEIGTDVAELFEANEKVELGDVLSIDENGKLKKSALVYDSKVAGIVSGAPAILFEGSQLQIAPQPFEFKEGVRPPLALVGRVKCKVTTQNGGPIKRGDLLVTSSKPGYAMKANPKKIRIGTVLGKALEPLDKGDGKIMVLVTH